MVCLHQGIKGVKPPECDDLDLGNPLSEIVTFQMKRDDFPWDQAICDDLALGNPLGEIVTFCLAPWNLVTFQMKRDDLELGNPLSEIITFWRLGGCDFMTLHH